MKLTNQRVINGIHEALDITPEEFLNTIQFPENLIEEIDKENSIVTVVAMHRFGLRSSMTEIALYAAERLLKIARPLSERTELEMLALKEYDADCMATINQHLEEGPDIQRDGEIEVGVLCHALEIPEELMEGVDKNNTVALSSYYLSKILEDQHVFTIVALQHYAINRVLRELVIYLNKMLEKERDEKGADIFNDEELLHMVSLNAIAMDKIQRVKSSDIKKEGGINSFDTHPTLQ